LKPGAGIRHSCTLQATGPLKVPITFGMWEVQMNDYHPQKSLGDRNGPLAAGQDTRSRARYRDTIIALAPLLDVARELGAILIPVRPPLPFRAELHRALVATARQQQVQNELFPLPGPSADFRSRVNDWAGQGLNELSEGDRRWFVGAAVVGSALSLAGLVGFVLLQRGRAA
jgi:hypothetical protein